MKHHKTADRTYLEVADSIENFLNREWVRANEIAVARLHKQTVVVTSTVYTLVNYLEETISSL